MERKNSYDFIRFLAAGLVVLAHAFAIAGLMEPSIGGVNVGGIGVYVFFMLSGYLITASWGQYPRFIVFLSKRVLRIFPAMIVATLLTVLILGPIFTTLSLHDYFINNNTLAYLNNILLINPVYSLPGVFANNPYPNAINGSIWTLIYEFVMYIVVAVLGASRLLNKKNVVRIWIGLFVAQLIIAVIGEEKFSYSIFYLLINQIVPLALMFLTGMIAYLYRDKIRLHMGIGVLALLLFVGLSTLVSQVTILLASVLLAYGLFALGNSPRLSAFSKYGDFSYGIYIYHFPILQILVALFDLRSGIKLFLIALPLSVLVGALSWWLVESRALRLKNKINLKKYPILQKDTAW